MSYTLDQLLEATGVNELSGGNLAKKASADKGENLSKLAERCRKAVDATPDERVHAGQQELVEKTAAVAIIRRTLSEIRDIEDAGPEIIKTASAPVPDQAQFVKAALEKGHSPQQIAEFLEKTAIVGRVGRFLSRGKAERGYRKAKKTLETGQSIGKDNAAHWQDLIRKHKGLPDNQKSALISRMRRKMGDEHTSNLMKAMGGGHDFKKLDSFKDLQKSVAKTPTPAVPGAAKKTNYAASMNLGGSEVGVTKAQAKKMKTPALYAGAGVLAHRAATGGGNNKKSSGRGPVIITG